MELVYSLINFLILFGGLFFLTRKLIKSTFAGRREKIGDDLEQAVETERTAERILREIDADHAAEAESRAALLAEAQQRVTAEHAQAEEDRARATEQIRQDAAQSEAQMKASSDKRLIADAVRRAAKDAVPLVRAERSAEARRALVERTIEKLSARLAELPEDPNAGAITAAVTSADPLTEAERAAVEKMLRAVRPGCQCVFETDERLVGGLRLCLGDTVYDGSLFHRLSLLEEAAALDDAPDAESQSALDESVRKKFSAAAADIDVFQTGEVVSVSDGICRVSGLSGVMAGEMLDFPEGLRGMVMDLDSENVGVVLLGSYERVQEGTQVRRTGRIIEVPVGDCMIGRVVDALGRPVDGRGPIDAQEHRAIESPAPSVLNRKSVSVPLQTGIKAIDALVPIGRGQRELIIGDRQTGKTAIAIDTILNQKDQGVLCIYVAVGQKESTVASVVENLRSRGAMEYTTVVCAHASEPAPMLYIAPYAGAAIGEHFMYQGKDVLIIYDDLSKQAVAYREISLLLQRPPGREAYPGDVFYLHSRLLERAARLSDELGGGSMTALPIIETQAGDISAYIPTNVISITDGQIFLETDLFHSGVRPAVNVGLSVSRVGGAAQLGAMKQVAGRLRMDLAQYRELASFAQFGSDLDKSTRATLERGAHMTELLKQPQYQPMDAADQVVAIFAAAEGYTDSLPLEAVPRFEEGLVEEVRRKMPALADQILTGKKLPAETLTELRGVIEAFKETF